MLHWLPLAVWLGVTLLLFGLRVGFGSDYGSYLIMFNGIADGAHGYDSVEPGYRFLNVLLSGLGLAPQSIIFVAFFVFLMPVVWAMLRYSPSIFLSVLIVVSLGLLFHSFNTIRQTMAFSVCLFGLYYVERSKPISFILIVAFAMTFHLSAFLFVVTYWMDWFRKKNGLYYIAISVGLLLCLVVSVYIDKFLGILGSLMVFFNAPYTRYFSMQTDYLHVAWVGNWYYLYFQLVIFLLIGLAYPFGKMSKVERIIVNSFLLGILLRVAFAKAGVVTRVSDYSFYLAFLAIPIVVYKSVSRQALPFVVIIVVLYCSSVYSVRTFLQTTDQMCYDNVFMSNDCTI